MCGLSPSERGVLTAWSKRPSHQEKVDKALADIQKALSIDSAYVGISWGKDSIVLLHLTQQVCPGIPAISFTHPERELISNYAEVENVYCDRFQPNLIDLAMDGDHVPLKVNAAKLWEQYPMALLGIRKEESQKRSITIGKYGVIHQYESGNKKGSWRCFPLAYWTWRDVWAYIAANDLPSLNAYADQPKATGRTTDHFSKSATKTWTQTRFENLKRLNPDYYRYLQTHYPEMV